MKFIIKGNFPIELARNIFVKSKLGVRIFPFFWFSFKILSTFKLGHGQIFTTLKALNISSDNVNSFFAYYSRDKRKRVYLVVKLKEDFVFVKKGQNVLEEKLPKKVISSLKENFFSPILPVKSILKNGGRINLYNYIQNENYMPARFDYVQALNFVNSLNLNSKFNTVDAFDYICELLDKSILEKELCSKIYKLLGFIKGHELRVGRVHKDLTSNNILKNDKGFHILDWETSEELFPIVIDLYGGQDWKEMINYFNNKIVENNSSDSKILDFYSFLILSAINNFENAKAWLLRNVH